MRNAIRVLDVLFMRIGTPPLQGRLGGLPFRGYLRHRSYIATDVRPETSYCDLFKRSVRPGQTVVDGGAHLGAYAVLAARALGGTGRVIAFEPDPYNLRALRYNVRKLAPADVLVSPKALAATRGQATFHVSNGTIGSSLFERADTTRLVTVETTTLDAELEGLDLGGGLLVKLNVEGAEPLVLEGMRETLDRVEEVTLYAEVHPTLLSQAGSDAAGFVRELERLEFSVFWLDVPARTMTVASRADLTDRGHLFCIRP